MNYTKPISNFKIDFINKGVLTATGEYLCEKGSEKKVPIDKLDARKFIINLLLDKIVRDDDMNNTEWFYVKYARKGVLLNVQDLKNGK